MIIHFICIYYVYIGPTNDKKEQSMCNSIYTNITHTPCDLCASIPGPDTRKALLDYGHIIGVILRMEENRGTGMCSVFVIIKLI